MANQLDDQQQGWIEAAGQSGQGTVAEHRVVSAAKFLRNNGHMEQTQICECLGRIDFSFPVIVARLPAAVFVQPAEAADGFWFTDTGLSPELFRSFRGQRTRKLWTPVGAVVGLKAVSRESLGSWIQDRLLQSIPPQCRPERLDGGGGTQYIVFDAIRMREV